MSLKSILNTYPAQTVGRNDMSNNSTATKCATAHINIYTVKFMLATCAAACAFECASYKRTSIPANQKPHSPCRGGSLYIQFAFNATLACRWMNSDSIILRTTLRSASSHSQWRELCSDLLSYIIAFSQLDVMRCERRVWIVNSTIVHDLGEAATIVAIGNSFLVYQMGTWRRRINNQQSTNCRRNVQILCGMRTQTRCWRKFVTRMMGRFLEIMCIYPRMEWLSSVTQCK